MQLEKYTPCTVLAPFVKEYILLESEIEIGNYIIPDTTIVMAFRYRGSVSMAAGAQTELLPAAAITGLRKTARHIQYAKDTANLLVVFREGGMHAFTPFPAHELFGLSIYTGDLFLPAALQEVTELLSATTTDAQRISIIETFLLHRFNHRQPDLLVQEAILQIRQQDGLIRIKDLAASLHISQDRFEKRFRALVGATPKQYASIIRLRALINKYPSYASLTAASYEAGYFDQAHFIKDFRLFTGKTPREFFQSAQYW